MDRFSLPPEPVRLLAKRVLGDLDAVADRLVGMIQDAEPTYLEGRTETRDLWVSCHDNVGRILQALAGEDAVDPFDAPRATGTRRAEQGMPLEAVLAAYRLGHRAIWDALLAEARVDGTLEPLVEAASHVWSVVDVYSSEVGRAYREKERDLVSQDDRRRDALVDALLEGRGRERALGAEAATVLDLPEHGRYVVLVLEGTGHRQPVSAALSVRGVRSAWRTRADREICLLAGSCGDELERALEQVPGVRAGLSPAVESLAEVDVAHRLAETALRALPRDEHGVADLDDRLPGALLVTAPDLADRLVDRALGPVLALEDDERDVLLQTLTTWLATGGSAGQTAARLYCHRNTVLNRLRRLEALTDRSLESVDDVVAWSLALLARSVLPQEPPA